MRSSSNKWTKTLHQDYLHRIANFCATVSNIFSKETISNNAKCRKQTLKFIWNTWKYCWNNTVDEILPVFAQTIFFSSTYGQETMQWEIVFGVI